MKTKNYTIHQQIDALLEAMWLKANNGDLKPGRIYNYARSAFIRKHRATIENAATI